MGPSRSAPSAIICSQERPDVPCDFVTQAAEHGQLLFGVVAVHDGIVKRPVFAAGGVGERWTLGLGGRADGDDDVKWLLDERHQ